MSVLARRVGEAAGPEGHLSLGASPAEITDDLEKEGSNNERVFFNDILQETVVREEFQKPKLDPLQKIKQMFDGNGLAQTFPYISPKLFSPAKGDNLPLPPSISIS
ncbi:hypothetical protein AVEN_228654-1 [Araneus ventricosus]|uniref:Uncharacterized protein n=1 Tax=Araneus ventricosus TaxID=182803 RepID=A0A4Y2EL18_ARAVE|nr:hypothetical protein AVEN_228654-1 [Araneus ventricosus]